MTAVRRAFVLASLGRYLMMAINLAATLIMARLLAPADYGVAVLGGSVLAVAEAIRALGGGAYLVQQKDLTSAQIHTNFTISLIATVILIAALLLLVRPLTGFFGRPELVPYLRVATLGFLAGPISYQISALMSRSLAFGRIAFITAVTAAVNASAGIGLALLGWGYMSLAWAAAISALAAMGLYLHFWRDWSIFRPALARMAQRLRLRSSMTVPPAFFRRSARRCPISLSAGRSMPARSGCANAQSCWPSFRSASFWPGSAPWRCLPSRSRYATDRRPRRAISRCWASSRPRNGQHSSPSFCWRTQSCGSCSATQWQGVVPVLQILAGALLFSFPIALHYPTLVALGAIRIVPVTILAQAVVTIGVLAVAAPFGLEAVALSIFVIVPFCSLLSLAVVRHFLKFGWLELAAATARSAVATLACAVGPLAVMAAAGWQRRSRSRSRLRPPRSPGPAGSPGCG